MRTPLDYKYILQFQYLDPLLGCVANLLPITIETDTQLVEDDC